MISSDDLFGSTSPDILEFHGEYRFLSNFWPAAVTLDEVTYPSIEHAYQAAKTLDPAERASFVGCAAGQAKRLGRSISLRSDWDAIKDAVMRDLVAQKFAPGRPLAQRLLATGAARIIEGNTWGDTYWGMCGGRGLNKLGEMLMAQRAHLHQLATRSLHKSPQR